MGFFITGTILLVRYRKSKMPNKGIQQSTLDFIESLEGRKRTVYKDSGGRETIGDGHLMVMPRDQYLLDKQPLSDDDINLLLSDDLARFESEIISKITVPLNQNKHDALIALEYNIGQGAFDGSTLVRLINSNASESEITNEWSKWNHVNGFIDDGLTNRRKKEISKYFSNF